MITRKLTAALSAVFLGTVALASFAADAAKLPEGVLAIHYYRPAGDYAPGDFAKCDFASCWGVHAWGDAYDQDTSWFKPVFPSGKDDFGVIYQIKANSDSSIAKGIDANYILHKADAKDQCSKDMSFSWEKSREIWVVSNDCNVYYSLDDAQKAMKK